MKTTSSQRILLILGLSILLTGPALAAFGDNTAPAANALPPGTVPSSQSDSEKTSKPPETQPLQPVKKSKKVEDQPPRTGS